MKKKRQPPPPKYATKGELRDLRREVEGMLDLIKAISKRVKIVNRKIQDISYNARNYAKARGAKVDRLRDAERKALDVLREKIGHLRLDGRSEGRIVFMADHHEVRKLRAMTRLDLRRLGLRGDLALGHTAGKRRRNGSKEKGSS